MPNANFKDIIGQKFGRLLVISREANTKEGRATWKCLCDCGNIKITTGKYLRQGHTHSCGCLHYDTSMAKIKNINDKVVPYQNIKDISGIKFGRLVAVKIYGLDAWSKAIWTCECDCGNTSNISISSLQQGLTKSCGCLLSNGEEKIQKLLEDNKISYKKQYQFNNLIGIGKKKTRLRFDFGILKEDGSLSHLLEYDGPQHYDSTNPKWKNYASEKLIIHDNMKNKYCQDNNIRLIRIRYHDILPDNLTIEDLL